MPRRDADFPAGGRRENMVASPECSSPSALTMSMWMVLAMIR
jgi:hypothetical protein